MRNRAGAGQLQRGDEPAAESGPGLFHHERDFVVVWLTPQGNERETKQNDAEQDRPGGEENETDVPMEIAAESVFSVACDRSFSTLTWALRTCSWTAAIFGAYFCRSAATCSSRSSRAFCDRRMRNSASFSPGFEVCLSEGHFQSCNLRLR